MKDIRWIQRLENFKKAFQQLEEAVSLYKNRGLSELEKQGMIQSFEYNFELSWNLIRDYFLYQGITEIRGSKDAFRIAFKHSLIEDGEVWMEMVGARNLTSHTYNKEMADQIIKSITEKYFEEFRKLLNRFEELRRLDEY